MSIRTKLLWSYIAMIAVPIILFALTVAAATSVLFKDGFNRDADADSSFPLTALHDLFGGRNELSSGLRFVARHDPSLLSDPKFLASTEAELAKVDADLVIAMNGSVAYASPGLSAEDVSSRLAGEDEREHEDRPGPPGRDSQTRISFTNADGTPGMLVMIADMQPVYRLFGKLIPIVLLSLILALALTNGVLTYFVSRSIIKPLSKLKLAADEIREGNLDKEVRLARHDEIGQLGAAFEEMRIRLKQSIGAQLQLEHNRKELLANISHDLKTPITAIQGCTQCLRDGIADTDEKKSKYIEMIADKTAGMNRMIEELLLYSTLDIGNVPFHWETLDLAAYLARTVEDLQLDPRLSKVEVTYLNDGNRTAYIRADREKLHRAILNIVDNSLKHMEHEPRLLRFELMHDHPAVVTVKITDNGAGIPEAALPQVFDRFFRGEPSRSMDSGSSGLGLAIVKQIIYEHGGTAEAYSVQGAGTMIALKLPLMQSDNSNRQGGQP